MDEILNLIESVSEGFPSYFFLMGKTRRNDDILTFMWQHDIASTTSDYGAMCLLEVTPYILAIRSKEQVKFDFHAKFSR